MARKRPSERIFSSNFANDTITMGAAGGALAFLDLLVELHSQLESIAGEDGARAYAHGIRLLILMESENFFTAVPLAIQTIGTITDTVDLNNSVLDQDLNSAINDVFGYQTLGPMRASRRVPTLDATSASGKEHMVLLTVDIPGNLLLLLNKEVETERLQNLSICIWGIATENNQVITVKGFDWIRYTERRKAIVLR